MEVPVNSLLLLSLPPWIELRAPVEYLALALFALILITYVRVRVSPAYKQRPDQIVERAPGQRRLGAPVPALPCAMQDVDFALLSQISYEKTPKGIKETQGIESDAATKLAAQGWKRHLFDHDETLAQKLQKSHLRVEVWFHTENSRIAVAFAGTVFTNIKDWLSNLRWFIPFHEDEYTETVRVFGPAFVKEFAKIQSQMKDPVHIELFSTGHSLGGGLAQQFAYALPEDRLSTPPVKRVFAFDPSPVTGYFSVRRRLRLQNGKGLSIDRIYERGEILAYLRSITNFIHKPSAIDPRIRQIRYYLFNRGDAVYRHSIIQLADGLWTLTHPIASIGPTPARLVPPPPPADPRNSRATSP
jgi:hypothetical protein